MRPQRRLWKLGLLLGAVLLGLSGCVYPAPGYGDYGYGYGYGGPAYYPYYYGPPAYGSVWIGGGHGWGGHHHWR